MKPRRWPLYAEVLLCTLLYTFIRLIIAHYNPKWALDAVGVIAFVIGISFVRIIQRKTTP